MEKKRILVVGAGISGSTIARELAEVGYSVTIIDQRQNLGGNCSDSVTEGIRIHDYGPHIFHTSSEKVWNWISRFTAWTPYIHRVKAVLEDGMFVTIPPNGRTKEIIGNDKIVDILYRPYSKKMWGTDDISEAVLRRIRSKEVHNNDQYFPFDKYQGLPSNGYTKMFENILNHENIEVIVPLSFSDLSKHETVSSSFDHVFHSGSIDEFYDYMFGILPYRSLLFYHFPDGFDGFSSQPTPVVNFTTQEKYTRITKWSMFPGHGSGFAASWQTTEESVPFEKGTETERFYPILDRDGQNRILYNRYLKHHKETNPNVSFIGRLGTYSYLDMSPAILNALSTAEDFCKNQ